MNNLLTSLNIKPFACLVLILGLSINTSAQIAVRSDKKVLYAADKAFDYGDYLTAYNNYRMVYELYKSDERVNYNLGVCCYVIKKYRKFSQEYFDKVSHESYPEVDYYLGILNHLSRKFDEARFHYKRYKNIGDRGEHTIEEIDDLIEKTNTAILFETIAKSTVQIENFGPTINTKYDEYVPLIPADESFLLFTSRRPNKERNDKDLMGDYFEDVYISYSNNGIWSNPEVLDTLINTSVHDACTGLSANGESMFLYRTNEDIVSGDIYESYFDSTWSKPVKLGENVNSNGNAETSACYSADGSVIFFSSNRPGGYGGKDLYRAKKLPNGTWSKPFNLGPKINTPYNEDAPFMHHLGNKLYFSSQGHRNMGGYDVFVSTFDEYGNFTAPENLGYPVNTVGDDIFFVLNPSSNTGYLSSSRSGGYGGYDIYNVKFNTGEPPLSVYNLYVFDQATNEVLTNVKMEVVDLKTNKMYGIYKSSKRTGKFLFITEPEREFRITIIAKGYETFTTNTVFLLSKNKRIFTLSKKN